MERSILLPWGEMNIPCRVYEPDFSDVDQVLIGIHGFGGNKDSSVLRAVAEEMYFYRTATVVFDFPGHGESTASARELNLTNCKGCLMAVAGTLPPCGEICPLCIQLRRLRGTLCHG